MCLAIGLVRSARPLQSLRIGEAKVPSPGCLAHDGDGEGCQFVLESVNVSALQPHLSGMLEQLKAGSGHDAAADCVLFQEHCIPKHSEVGLCGMANSASAKLAFTPTDPLALKPSAGVGALANKALAIHPR